MPKVNYYHPDDVQAHFKRARNQRKTTARLRRSITPGTILILLAGRFKGRRVVFLKQLESGLLLVTGPYKANGVPLRRVNQAYVQPTSTKIDVSGVDVSELSDYTFSRKKSERDISKRTAWDSLEKEKPDAERLEANKLRQAKIDKGVLAEIAKVPLLKKYLGTRFSLRSGMKPHDMNF